MDSLDQFLLQTRIDLDLHRESLDRKDFLQPYRHIFWMEYLMPVGMKIPTKFEVMSLRHFFIRESVDTQVYKSATVIHGHTSEGNCAAPKLCHLYGFWPTSEYSFRFNKIFIARWKSIYVQNNWEIP